MTSRNGSESAAEPTAESLVGTMLADRYRLDELLGEGGMGKVYAAEHVLMKKRVAVKILHHELCSVPEVIARFEREAMATGNINHPNIAAATDGGKLPDGSLFLVLELVEGRNLRDEIAQGAMPLKRAIHIAQQIASALAAAHALGIVHRDLKPENVMLISKGQDDNVVKVLDFGIAKLPPPASSGRVAAGPLTKAGMVFGTPEYMSPEQALGQNVDARSDVYALGVIAYEMLCGVRPFSSESETGLLGQQLAKPVPPFAERAPDVRVPRQVEEVVQKLLAKDKSERYQTADEAAEAFAGLLEAPAAQERLFTLPDGSSTAFLGTAEQVFAPPPDLELPVAAAPPVAPAPPTAAPVEPQAPVSAPLPAPAGPSGTLPLLNDAHARRLAESVQRARSDQVESAPGTASDRFELAADFAESALANVLGFIDEHRGRLPERVRHALRDAPAGALLAILIVVSWGAMSIGFTLIASGRSHSKPETTHVRSEAVPSARPAAIDPVVPQLAVAKKLGHDALVKLAEQHPKHPKVLLALALSHAKKAEYDEAMTLIGRALDADPEQGSEAPAGQILAAAARQTKYSKAAFELLEGPMGAEGATVLYDLSADAKVPYGTRKQAERWVRSEAFEKVASPAVAVAAGLRYAKSCSARHELLPRAGEIGDRRALAYLKLMKIRSGCGRRGHDDCFPCIRKDKELESAIEAIEKRLPAKP